MPLTDLQRRILAALATSGQRDRYLAGGALHFTPDSARYSHDLDFFHDSAARVAAGYAADSEELERRGFGLELVFSQPGFIRAVVTEEGRATQLDWAHDSAWRFMPLVEDELGGLLLDRVDLAVNKALALAGRDEARDLVDILYAHETILPLGALVWAAIGKDPGFTPLSLLEQLRRVGRYRPEDIERLDLAAPFDFVEAKQRWLKMLDDAEAFVGSRPPDEAGCLYYSAPDGGFREPAPGVDLPGQGLLPHYGRPGGVLPRATDQRLDDSG